MQFAIWLINWIIYLKMIPGTTWMTNLNTKLDADSAENNAYRQIKLIFFPQILGNIFQAK